MRNKILKLVLAAVVLAGGLAVGGPPRAAAAASFCPNRCCDSFCLSVRRCFRFGSSCICEQNCVVLPELERAR